MSGSPGHFGPNLQRAVPDIEKLENAGPLDNNSVAS
jgi:hypothetical protein